MIETARIADQLKRAFYGKAWSGPSVKEALAGVRAEIAARKPISGAHSIWELVHHITAWVEIVRKRVEGKNVKVTRRVNFPPVLDASPAGWKKSLRRMEQAEAELRKTILRIPEPRLEESAADGRASVYILLHGVSQHSLYHAGQIMLLKRFPSSTRGPGKAGS